MNGSLCFDFYFSKSTDGTWNGRSGDGSARATTEDHKVKFLDIHFPDCLIRSSGLEIRRRQASPSNSGPELNSPSRDMGFFRAGTEHARSASHFPDPRLFAIASSLHLNSFVVLRGSILQLTFHVSFVV
jgi:hypothetical protein